MTPWASKERPLKVVHVIGGLALGGAETLLYRLATQDVPGVEQEVICLGRTDWYSARLQERGIPVHHLDMDSPLETWSGGRRLRKLLRERRPDAVQSWLYFANMLSSVSAGSHGPPVVLVVDAAAMQAAGHVFYCSANGVWLTDHVPPAYLREL